MAAGQQYPLVFKSIDLSGPPGTPVTVIEAGIPIADIFINSPIPPGLNFKLIYGDASDGLVFGPGGLLCHTNICPRHWMGIRAVWDVASPGTLVKVAFSAGQGSQGVA